MFDDSTMMGVVSITDYAQSSLGDVVFVELPTVGSEVTQGGESPSIFFFFLGETHFHSFLFMMINVYLCDADQIGAVESVKAASDIVEWLMFLFA